MYSVCSDRVVAEAVAGMVERSNTGSIVAEIETAGRMVAVPRMQGVEHYIDFENTC